MIDRDDEHVRLAACLASTDSDDQSRRVATMSNFYQRGHQKQQDSYVGGGASSSWNLPPLSLPGTLALHLGFAIKGAQDAMNLRVAGEKIQLDRVSPLLPFL